MFWLKDKLLEKIVKTKPLILNKLAKAIKRHDDKEIGCLEAKIELINELLDGKG